MRPGVLWMLVLLGLSGLGATCGTAGAAAEEMSPGSKPGIERAEAPGASPPALDLRIEPPQLPSSEAPATGSRVTETDRSDHDPGADQGRSDRGLSFGLEVEPRSQFGNLARKDDPADPSLEGQLQRLIERPTFGVRGRYRF